MKIRDCVATAALVALIATGARAAVPVYSEFGPLEADTLPIETSILPPTTYKSSFSTVATILTANYTLESWLTLYSYDESGAQTGAVASYQDTILDAFVTAHLASVIFISPGYTETSWWENGNVKTATDYSSKVLFTAALAGDYVGDRYSFMYADVPEPATWAMMIAGFGLVGLTLRRGRRVLSPA